MKVYKINVNGKVYEVEVEVSEKNGSITNDNKVSIEDSSNKDGEFVKSPMQGSILSVNVKKGDKVLKGDVLLILEAMKMENEIVSNVSGVVEDVFVVKGKNVDNGEILLVIK